MNQNTKDLELLISACEKTGAILRRYFGRDILVEIKESAGKSPVTVADKEADRFLKETLLSARPNYGWLSEETERDASHLQTERAFVVDPMDGTKPFIAGIPEFVVSAAVVEHGKPVVGVIYNPVKEEMFTCAKGQGLDYNGELVRKPLNKKPTHFLASCGEIRKGYLEPFKYAWNIQQVGSVAYKMALVAAGKAEFTATFRPKSEWDVAAAHVMCEEVGLKIGDFYGNMPLYNEFYEGDFVRHLLVAHPDYFDAICEDIENVYVNEQTCQVIIQNFQKKKIQCIR